MPTLRRLCVYAGSNPGARPEYAAAAAALAQQMAARKIGLVYGGGKVGLMGVLADTILGAGGEAVGVMPQALVNREIAHTGLTELKVVDSMHERKAQMAELVRRLRGRAGRGRHARGARRGVHVEAARHPRQAVRRAGRRGLLRRVVGPAGPHGAGGLPARGERAGLVSASDPGALLDRLEAWEPVAVTKWLDLDDS